MASQPQQTTAAEKAVSKPREEIIREAKRIEESLLHSSKGHFAAAGFWSVFHLLIGIPAAVLAATAGAVALRQFDPSGVIATACSIAVVILTSLMTFLNPNSKASVHLNAGNSYDALMSKVRIFWSIDCWKMDSDDMLTERLKNFSEHKDKLNQTCPQIPRFAYRKAKKGIAAGEGSYRVDAKEKPG